MSDPQVRVQQIKGIEEEERRKHFIYMAELKHKHIMEEIKALKESNINHFHRGDF